MTLFQLWKLRDTRKTHSEFEHSFWIFSQRVFPPYFKNSRYMSFIITENPEILDAHTILMKEKRKIVEKGFDPVTETEEARRIRQETNKISQLKYDAEKRKHDLEKEATDLESDPKKKRKHLRTKKEPTTDPKIFAEQLRKTLEKKVDPTTKITKRKTLRLKKRSIKIRGIRKLITIKFPRKKYKKADIDAHLMTWYTPKVVPNAKAIALQTVIIAHLKTRLNILSKEAKAEQKIIAEKFRAVRKRLLFIKRTEKAVKEKKIATAELRQLLAREQNTGTEYPRKKIKRTRLLKPVKHSYRQKILLKEKFVSKRYKKKLQYVLKKTRKVDPLVRFARVHIRVRRRNTFLTCTTRRNRTLLTLSAGTLKFPGRKKSMPFARESIAEKFARRVLRKRYRLVDIHLVSKLGKFYRLVIRALARAHLIIRLLWVKKLHSHGSMRPKKLQRK